jgi:allantoinase
LNHETQFEYGARAGFWRYHRLFTKKKVPVTVMAVAMALERNPAVCHALKETPTWEVATQGYRWENDMNDNEVDEETAVEHLQRAIKLQEKLLGKRPVGYYSGAVRADLSV